MNYYNCALLLPMFTQPCDVTLELISMSSYNMMQPTQANTLLTSCYLPLGTSVESSCKSSVYVKSCYIYLSVLSLACLICPQGLSRLQTTKLYHS